MKLLSRVGLFVLIAALTFAGPGAADAATVSLSAVAGSSIGVLTGSTAPNYVAKAYSLSTASSTLMMPGKISLSGTAFTSGDIISVDINGSIVSTVQVPASGSWSLSNVDFTFPKSDSLISVDVVSSSDATVSSTINLTHVPVTVSPLVFSGSSTASPLSFIVGSPDIAGTTVTGGASYTVGSTTTSADASAVTLKNGGFVVATGTDLWGIASPAGVQYIGIAGTSLTPALNIATPTGGPIAAKPSTAFVIEAESLTLTDSVSVTVAGSANVQLGTFNAQVFPKTLTLASTDIALVANIAANASFDATMNSYVGVDSYTIATGTTATDSTASSVTWNGLTVSADFASKKILIAGTPAATGIGNFIVFAKNAAAVVASADFKITVSNSVLPAYSLGLTFPSFEAELGDTFDDEEISEVNVMSGDSVVSVPLSTLTFGNSGSSFIWTGKGLTFMASAVDKKITVSGTASSVGSMDVQVKGTSSAGTIAPATLSLSITGEPGFVLTLNPASITGATGTLINRTVSTTLDVSGENLTNYTLKIDGDTLPLTKNGVTVSLTSTGKSLSVSGTPLTNGTYTFPISAWYDDDSVASQNLTLQIGSGGSVIVTDPFEVELLNTNTGSLVYYNGNNFRVGQTYKLYVKTNGAPLNLNVSRKGPGDTVFQSQPYTMENGEIVINFTPLRTGSYTWAFDYIYGAAAGAGARAVGYQELTLSATNSGSSSSGGCDGGFGFAALALGALLILKRGGR